MLNSPAMKLYKLWLPFLLCLPLLPALAKEQPAQTMVWPETGTPVLRFTFGKFKQIGSRGAERTYDIDTTAENLSGKMIPNASFFLYLFAKNKVRIGEGWISLTNIAPGETVKFQTTASAAGVPVSLSVETRAPRTVTITVNSVPQGGRFQAGRGRNRDDTKAGAGRGR